MERQRQLDEMDDDNVSMSSGSSGSSSMSGSSGSSGSSSMSGRSGQSMKSKSSMGSVSGKSVLSGKSLSSQGSSASAVSGLSDETESAASKDSGPSKRLTKAIGKCENAKIKTQKAINDSVKQTAKQEKAINDFKDNCNDKPCKCKKQSKAFQESLATNKAKNEDIQRRLDDIGECDAPIKKSPPKTSAVKKSEKKKHAEVGDVAAQIGAELAQDDPFAQIHSAINWANDLLDNVKQYDNLAQIGSEDDAEGSQRSLSEL